MGTSVRPCPVVKPVVASASGSINLGAVVDVESFEAGAYTRPLLCST